MHARKDTARKRGSACSASPHLAGGAGAPLGRGLTACRSAGMWGHRQSASSSACMHAQGKRQQACHTSLCRVDLPSRASVSHAHHPTSQQPMHVNEHPHIPHAAMQRACTITCIKRTCPAGRNGSTAMQATSLHQPCPIRPHPPQAWHQPGRL